MKNQIIIITKVILANNINLYIFLEYVTKELEFDIDDIQRYDQNVQVIFIDIIN